MQVFFKMIIDDGEKYYAGEDPGVAICDYVYMRGLNVFCFFAKAAQTAKRPVWAVLTSMLEKTVD